jgi:hypothetical protein
MSVREQFAGLEQPDAEALAVRGGDVEPRAIVDHLETEDAVRCGEPDQY